MNCCPGTSLLSSSHKSKPHSLHQFAVKNGRDVTLTFYWCIGLGLILYYCSQGIGMMRWSYAGSLMRLGIVAVMGSAAVHALHADVASLYRIMAGAMVISCAVTVLGILYSDWRPLALTREMKKMA